MVQKVEYEAEIAEEKAFIDELEEEDSNAWIVTFADLVTLLLVFFIMLYTISSVDLIKFRSVAHSMRHTFGAVGAEKMMQIQDPEGTDKRRSMRQVKEITMTSSQEERLVHAMNKAIKKRNMQGSIISYIKDGKPVIHVSGKVLFQSGAAELNEGAKPVLNELLAIMNENPHFQVSIKGHTDNDPISTLQFPSNWELSAIRATTVLRHLVTRGFEPKNLTATGYGDVMPLFPNNTPANRAKNRRIEFVLEKKKTD